MHSDFFSRAAAVVIFLAALVVLRAGIVWMDDHVGVRQEYADVVSANDIDPSALFYTELSQALAAEKEVRATISGDVPQGRSMLRP